jgi:serine/threonine protein phosphatase PrpC/outer membrane biosynthesis protein TonB
MNQPVPSQPLPIPIIWGESNVGKQRNHNEDQVYPDSRHKTSLRPPTPQAVQARGYLLVVSDGIGGAQVGDTAANFAVRAVTDHYYADPRAMSLDRLLQSAVEIANTNVYNYVRTSPAFQQAGCTLTAAAIRGSELVVAHVGDSRAYLLQDGKINRLTRDHNVAEMMASGQPLPGGGQGLAGNMLVRSLGAGPAVEVDIYRPILKPGDTVLLCSDGLHGVVSDEEIRQIAAKETPEKGARKLIDLANARGGPDNISVVIARVPAAAAAAAVGAKSSNRITAMVIAALALLGVLAVLLFALNGFNGGVGDGTATPAVVAMASPSGVATEPDASAAAVEAPATGESATPVDTSVAPASTMTPAPTTSRPPTSTPASTPTPIPPPTSTPRPTQPLVVQPPAPSVPPPASSLAPTLVSPGNGTEQRDSVLLQWSFGRPLRPGERYRVTIRTDRNQMPRELPPFYTEDTSYQVRFDDDEYRDFFHEDNTTYYWSVLVISQNGNPASPSSAESSFVLRRGQPPAPATDTPAPPAVETATPTFTPTPEQPTNTPTPEQPTNTPTPPRGG